jgi:hypothetical protein
LRKLEETLKFQRFQRFSVFENPGHPSFNPLKFQRFVLPAEYNLIAFLIILITPMSSKRFPESLFSHRLSACRNNKTPTLSALRHAPPILGWY